MRVFEEFVGNKDTIKKKLKPVILANKLIIQGKEIPLPNNAFVRMEYNDESGGKILSIRANWK